MKKIIALVLCFSLLFCSCGTQNVVENTNNKDKEAIQETSLNEQSSSDDIENEVEPADQKSYKGLNDKNLLIDVENTIYDELLANLDGDSYFIENVEATYYPKEYIEELEFNSKENVYFGYTASELDKQFQGTKYVFTLGENGETIAVPMETLQDDTCNEVMRDVAVGTGVILICVTVSVVSGGIGVPAISMIFAASAQTATAFALSGTVIGGISAAMVTAYQTEDFEKTVKAAALGAADGFKWGAFIGAVSGGVSEGLALKGMTANGLTMNEAAFIQKESKWPLEAIKTLHSKAEYEIYRDIGLKPTQMKDGTWAMLRDIDWKLVDSKGRTNIERVRDFKIAPIDANGRSYDLHHIGMREDSPLAIMTYDEHHAKETYKILHYKEEGKNITDAAWETQKDDFWDAVLEMAGVL